MMMSSPYHILQNKNLLSFDDVIGHTHRLHEAWLLMLVGHPHQSPPLALHSYGYFPPLAKSTNSTMLYFASTFFSHANCTYSSISNSSLSRFKEEMRFANSFDAPFILDFSRSPSMEKWTLQSIWSTCKILDIIQSFCMIWNSSLSTLQNTTY